jgi:UDP-glucose 4-epimerase
MKNVAMTGIGGYLGGLLLDRLDREGEVERVVGIDVKAPRSHSPKLKFYGRDVRQSFTDVFIENDIDTALHLAFAVTPVHDERGSHSINIDGSNNFLMACEQAGVKQLFYISSYTAYGAHADNPESITEDAHLRPNPGFLYPNDKAKVDIMFQEYMAGHQDACVTIIRIAAVAGPNVVPGGLTQLFTPVMFRPKGYNPLWQFLHEVDLVEVVTVLLKQKQKGIFNVAADGGMRLTEIIKALHKPYVILPGGLLKWATSLSWKLHLQSRSPGGVDLLMHPVVVNTEKLKKATGYQFQYTGQEAFMSFVNSRKGL